MELRQLTTEQERQTFAECLAKARSTRGVGFVETRRSALGKAHLAFGNIYALFEKPGAPAEQMLGGFIMHDLATLPPSHPKPDLSHIDPRSVIEGSELWSLSTGVGRIAGLAAAAVAGLSQAKAIVVYPIVRPVDLTPRYSHFHFVNACEPVKWPYIESSAGEEMWVQPMILEGAKLEAYIRSGFEFLFQCRADRWVLPLDTTLPKVAATDTASQLTPRNLPTSSDEQSHERNGSVSA